MADFNLGDFMDRVVEMEKESVASIVSTEVDAVPYFPYEQEAFPYWTNRITGMTPSYLAEDAVEFNFRIVGRIVLGHLTEGYKGEPIVKAQDYISAVLDYFKGRSGMKSVAHPTSMQYLAQYFLIVDMVGPNAFRNDGIGSTQVGIDFVFTLPIMADRHR